MYWIERPEAEKDEEPYAFPRRLHCFPSLSDLLEAVIVVAKGLSRKFLLSFDAHFLRVLVGFFILGCRNSVVVPMPALLFREDIDTRQTEAPNAREKKNEIAFRFFW